MAKLIFEDEDVESHANMDYKATFQNSGHTQQNGTHAPVEAERIPLPRCVAVPLARRMT